MNRKDRRNIGRLIHPDGDHARMPIMAMNNIRFPEIPGKFRRTIGKKGKPPSLILSLIDPTRIKHRMTKQIKGDICLRHQGFIHRKILKHRRPFPNRFFGDFYLVRQKAVVGHKNSDIMPQLTQYLGQRANHISHSTCFGKGGNFGRDK